MFGFAIPWIKIGVAITIALVVYAGYYYVSNQSKEISRLTKENATLVADIETLNSAIITQQDTINSLQKDFEKANELRNEVEKQFTTSRNRVRLLEDKLSQHELGFLASQRPGLVENIINNATDDINRCFEIASGSPLTAEELDADRPSLYNSECPDLANPKSRNTQ